ncbi:MAG TPA: diguanylate cyclase [Noviherbaspirillum sp.]|nr:diguanylate cyclase [Noviherbaspirillum sp.]
MTAPAAGDMLDTIQKRIGSAVAALAAVAASGYFAYDFRWRQGLVELEQEAASRLELAAAAVFAPTQKFGYLPELLASHPTVIDAFLHKDSSHHIAQANTYLEQVNLSARSAVAYLLDLQGRTIAASNWREPGSFVGANYGFRPYFQEALKNGKASFYGMGTTSLLPGYYISHRVRKDGRTIGVAVVKVDMTRLDMEWRWHKDEVAVTDNHGVIFLSTQADWKYRPIHPLDAPTLEKLKRTRQYETVLKPPLPVRVLRQLKPDEQIVSLPQSPDEGTADVHYLIKSQPIKEADWRINVLIPLDEMEARAMRIALIVSSTAGLLLMSLMHLRQAQVRAVEREKSRLALEQAHEALELKHAELQKASEDLRIASITDPLTGAYNRRFFFESVPKIVSAANRHHFPLSIVTIDVDHFKRINDMYGHPAGDKVLQVLTAICKESLREADVFCRFGGEEFIMALPSTDAEAAENVAERLRIKVSQHPLEVKGKAYGITISCGVSRYREGERGIDDTLRRADDALYVAKNEGRNRVVVR